MLLLRLLKGLQSAEGEREPRCLYPPSPPLRTGNNLAFSSSPPLLLPVSFSSNRSDTLDVRRPSSSSSPQAEQTCRFWFSSCCDSSSPPSPLAPCVRSTLLPSTSYMFPPSPRCSCVVFWSYPSLPLLFRRVISCENEGKKNEKIKQKHHSIPPHDYRGARWKGGREAATEQQECGWYFTMPGKLVWGNSAVKRGKNIYFIPHI